MELEATILKTFGSRFALTTLKAQDVGAKHWIIFVTQVMKQTECLLFTLQDLPPSPSKLAIAERKLLLFAAYLSRAYPPTTVSEYISHVKSRHFFWLHYHDFEEFGIVFHRVNIFLRIRRKQVPRVLRKKVPFTRTLLARTWQVTKANFINSKFDTMIFWCVSTMAFQQLMRLNELVTMPVQTQANLHPITVDQLSFRDADGGHLQFPASTADARARLHQVAYAVVIAPPTKADPTASNEPYYLPMSVGTAQPLAPCGSLWFFMAAFPIPQMARASTPLFRTAAAAFSAQIKDYRFSVLFKAACRRANIRYETFGKHRYRVGGLNAMQDAGCTVTQIMAAGHWRSDAWQVYARREKVSLMHYANMMLR
jgi:hypothetical protein